MLVSTKGRFALRMMVDLAQHVQEEKCSLKEISERQGVSLKYLEQIVPLLTRSGLIRSMRGARGGYHLSRRPEQYTIGDILRATEGNMLTLPCLDPNAPLCERQEHCVTLPFWSGLQDAIDNYIDGTTLEGLIQQYENTAGDDYCI